MNEKKTILVIDDEVDFVKLVEFHLTKKGYHVLTALDGETGLKKSKCRGAGSHSFRHCDAEKRGP